MTEKLSSDFDPELGAEQPLTAAGDVQPVEELVAEIPADVRTEDVASRSVLAGRNPNNG